MNYATLLCALCAIILISGCGQPQTTGPQVQPSASCMDGIQNQGEQAIDCGGPCNPCVSCTDGVQNQGETGVDCGGPCKACETCSDGLKNQGETGIDCGGPCKQCGQAIIPQPTPSTSNDVSAEDRAFLQTKMQEIIPSALAKTTARNLKVGDSFVFALGVRNTKLYDSKFKVDVVFLNAKDTNNNPLAINDRVFDDSYILQWFGSNDFSKEYELDVGSSAIIPIVVNVKDQYTAGKATAKGSYYFRLDISNWDEFGFWDEYSSKEFTVVVA